MVRCILTLDIGAICASHDKGDIADRLAVYFLYPETANVRLEDMDALFGDATTAMPTPAQQAEVDSLMSIRSPVPSLDIRRPGNFTADNAIPGLDINPPAHPSAEASEGKTANGPKAQDKGEGVGGWISRIAQKAWGDGRSGGSGGGGSYGRLENQED